MGRVSVVVVLVLAAGVWPAAAEVAHGSTAAQATPAQRLQADFNDDGAEDLAVGVPGEDTGGPPFNSGAVNVLYGSAGGLTGTGSQLFSQASPGFPATPRTTTPSVTRWPPEIRVPHRRRPQPQGPVQRAKREGPPEVAKLTCRSLSDGVGGRDWLAWLVAV